MTSRLCELVDEWMSTQCTGDRENNIDATNDKISSKDTGSITESRDSRGDSRQTTTRRRCWRKKGDAHAPVP